MYQWESNGKQQRRNLKKTGTVVFHPDEHVSTDFASYTRSSKLSSSKHHGAGESEKQDVQLMTEATAEALQKAPFKFTALLPGQAQCYRGIFKGRDVILHSRTGSGKTLAYALPLIERRLTTEAHASAAVPFMLIFVFSIELAFQTKSVLESLYGSRGITFAIAGIDSLDAAPPHVLIGTVEAIDTAVRGADAASSSAKKRKRRDETKAAADEDEASESSEDDDDESNAGDSNAAKMDVSGVRAIVVDEVDTTLGPRYSGTGRRMRDLLKVIRRANGSLTDQLTSDFRSHHYVLCGATIPNWVIKAGFLGNKKFYYQLVEVGLPKLPAQLECFMIACKATERTDKLSQLVTKLRGKRLVVFTHAKRVRAVETQLKQLNDAKITVRSLDGKKDELQRVQEIADFCERAANVIVCTDVAARGLDFPDVDVVIMDHIPDHTMAAEAFVHRAGRTARVNKTGRVIVLCDPSDDEQSIRAVEASTHITFKRMTLTAAEKLATMQLRVGSAFGTGGAAAAVEDPVAVLRRVLGDAFEHVADIKEDDSKRKVTFRYPTDKLESLKKSLWKYDLREAK